MLDHRLMLAKKIECFIWNHHKHKESKVQCNNKPKNL